MIILFFKALRHSLFDAPVQVQGHTTKHGTFVAPYHSRRRKRLAPPASGDLIGVQHTASPTCRLRKAALLVFHPPLRMASRIAA